MAEIALSDALTFLDQIASSGFTLQDTLATFNDAISRRKANFKGLSDTLNLLDTLRVPSSSLVTDSLTLTDHFHPSYNIKKSIIDFLNIIDFISRNFSKSDFKSDSLNLLDYFVKRLDKLDSELDSLEFQDSITISLALNLTQSFVDTLPAFSDSIGNLQNTDESDYMRRYLNDLVGVATETSFDYDEDFEVLQVLTYES